MEKIKYYTSPEALDIIIANTELRKQYDKLLPYHKNGELDHSFKYGNFFNLCNNIYDNNPAIVIQWLDSNGDSNEVIVKTLDEAVVTIWDIERTSGNIKE